MAEFTKGELTQGKSNTLLYINGINFGDVLVGGLPHEKCEANAKELVRRWNAFEEGGIVDELRKACKIGLGKALGISKVAAELGAPITITHQKQIERIEAALAKS